MSKCNLITRQAAMRDRMTSTLVSIHRPDSTTDSTTAVPSEYCLPVQDTNNLEATATRVQPLSILCGIYFLCVDRTVVYIGQSRHVHKRIDEHKRSGKTFDAVFYVEVPEDELSHAETACLYAYRPALNKPSSYTGMPFSHHWILDKLNA